MCWDEVQQERVCELIYFPVNQSIVGYILAHELVDSHANKRKKKKRNLMTLKPYSIGAIHDTGDKRSLIIMLDASPTFQYQQRSIVCPAHKISWVPNPAVFHFRVEVAELTVNVMK